MPHTDGIDVSKWQGLINWDQVATTGIWWGATRIWDRQVVPPTVDAQFARNRAGMARIGLRFRLLYWFLENRSPEEQAAQAWFVAQGHLDVGEAFMLDAESNCTEEQAWTWITQVESFTHRPVVVYTNRNVDGGRIWNSTRIFDGTRARIYPDYKTGTDVELTWDELYAKVQQRTAPQGYDIWQFSSTGAIPGIAGNVDLDQVDNWQILNAACGYA